MYRLVAYGKTPFNPHIIEQRTIAEWVERPDYEVVQRFVERFEAPFAFWIGQYCGQLPPDHAKAAIWFKLEYNPELLQKVLV